MRGADGIFQPTVYLCDPQGDVLLRLDGEGEVRSADLYDAWGALRAGGDTRDPYGYRARAGYYTDHETGLLLCGHRYYAPMTGRFLTRDPIGKAGGPDVYAYCGNDPVNQVDPKGLRDIIADIFNPPQPLDAAQWKFVQDRLKELVYGLTPYADQLRRNPNSDPFVKFERANNGDWILHVTAPIYERRVITDEHGRQRSTNVPISRGATMRFNLSAAKRAINTPDLFRYQKDAKYIARYDEGAKKLDIGDFYTANDEFQRNLLHELMHRDTPEAYEDRMEKNEYRDERTIKGPVGEAAIYPYDKGDNSQVEEATKYLWQQAIGSRRSPRRPPETGYVPLPAQQPKPSGPAALPRRPEETPPWKQRPEY